MPPASKMGLERIYRALLDAFGPQGWWPAETPFEVCIGAILTQNTNWRNVETAVGNLKKAGLLDPAALRSVRRDKLARAIRSAGYYNQKTERLKFFSRWFGTRLKDSFKNARGVPSARLRNELLDISGIGPETADSMLLYGFGRTVFVVDAYTRRIVERHRLVPIGASYDEIKSFFESNLKKSLKIFNEFHALIVRLGKTYCKTVPRCDECPLRDDKHI